ncbi:Pol [Symbiodinium sp. CCMP2592]|nr:Pol [Symbiodinium sp. CCMP2592]
MTYNVGGMASDLYDVLSQWLQSQTQADVIFLQELHWGCGRTEGSWKIGGRVLHVQCKQREKTLDLVSAYQWVWQANKQAEIEAKRQRVWTALGNLLQRLPQRHLLIIGAHLNSNCCSIPGLVGRGLLRQAWQHADPELAELMKGNRWRGVEDRLTKEAGHIDLDLAHENLRAPRPVGVPTKATDVEKLVTMGWLAPGPPMAWPFLTWDAVTQRTVVDTAKEPLSQAEVLEDIDILLRGSGQGNKPHPTRPMAEEMRGDSIVFLIQVSAEGESAANMRASLKALCQNASLQLVAMQLKADRANRSTLATSLAAALPRST